MRRPAVTVLAVASRGSLPIALVLVLVLVLALASRASAQPTDLVARPLVLGQGELEGTLVADINLAPRQLGHSTSLAPDVWYGVTPRLTVGLIHSNPSVDRFAVGATFCVVHQPILGCEDTYRGSGIDTRWSAVTGDLAVAPRARVLVRELDPVKPAATLGALVRWRRGRFAITADPYLQIGLANRDQGNRHALFLPIAFAVQPLARWELSLQTGWNSIVGTYAGVDGDRHVITDAWHVPVVVGTRVAASAHVDLGIMVAFASLLGPQNTAKERALFATVTVRSGRR